MKQIIIRACRVVDSDDIYISGKELFDYLCLYMGDNVGNEEKLSALYDALNNREHNIPIREKFSWVSVDMSKPIFSPYYMLSIKV